MINGMTVEEYNAREKQSGVYRCQAARNTTPMEGGDTEESLRAEYLALTGEAYRSQEEEQADNVQAAKERRQQRIEAQLNGRLCRHRSGQGQRFYGLPCAFGMHLKL